MTRALVLGGGGVTGIAWEIGVLTGLRDAGIDVTAWDLVVGTSAGAVVGAKMQGGVDLDGLFAEQSRAATREDDLPIRRMGGPVAVGLLRAGRRRGLGWAPGLWLTASVLETFVRDRAGRGRTRSPDLEPHPGLRPVAGPDRALAHVGRFGLAARTASETTFREVIRATLDPVTTWPDALVVTAIDVLTGTTVGIDARSGVPFVDAVAASCAVPGLMPSITLGGRRYMDGGMASQTHAELASRHDEVLVIAPLDLGRLGGEIERLRANGGRVTVVTPGPAAARVLGRDIALLDPGRRARAAGAGRVDGLAAGEELPRTILTGHLSE